MVRLASQPEPDLIAQWCGLPPEFTEAHGITICPEDGEKPGWITIPCPNLTGLWYNRYRNPDMANPEPKYWQRPGTIPHLFNPQRLGPNADLIVFTEGEKDCLTLTYLGYPAIGITGAGQGNRFRGSWKLLFDETYVVVAMDPDPAGRAASESLLDLFLPRATVLDQPDGKDINDWFKEDEAGLRAALDSAIKELSA